MLRRWGLEPVILDQLPSQGQTIIEKLEHYQADVSFAVVLATPDDEGRGVTTPTETALRARQNVVLELGMRRLLPEPWKCQIRPFLGWPASTRSTILLAASYCW